VIPDTHRQLLGLRPVLFSFHGLEVSSYAVFMALGIGVALIYFWLNKPKPTNPERHAWVIIPGALLFGSIGAKLMALVLVSPQFGKLGWMQFLYSGRTIVGGLLGGWLGVMLLKKLLGIRSRYGNVIAPAACLGIALGRMGCFLGSCCWGKPTSLPIAINFGDGQLRHPTQIYEALFCLGLFIYLHLKNRCEQPPGSLFRQFLLAYFSFRFVIEFLRDEPVMLLGLTAFQVVSAVMVLALLAKYWLRAPQETRVFQPKTPSRLQGTADNADFR
jgi:phosphatidylglycerol:prolipoprotein diacylglycerol transferase